MRQTYSLTPELIADIREIAKLLDRSISWTIRAAWALARPKLIEMAKHPWDKPRPAP